LYKFTCTSYYSLYEPFKETDEEILDCQIDVVVDVVILVVTIVVAAVVSYTIYRLSRHIESVKNMLQEKTRHLEKEQNRTETLLSHLVPSKIAKRMRTHNNEPEQFCHVTVMCTAVNLDLIERHLSPLELLTIMNDVMDIFERRITKYNVTKIGYTGMIQYHFS